MANVRSVTLVGHPFAPIGRGEDLRATYRALKAAGLAPRVVDVWGGRGQRRDPALEREIAPDLTDTTGNGTEVFVINGDEIAPVLTHLGARRTAADRSIVFVAWELSIYPAEWASQLARFTDVWVHSAFVRDAVVRATNRPAQVILGATGVLIRPFVGRRHFGLPEGALVFLTAFDLRSFVERKNPLAAVEAFARFCRSRPALDAALIVKLSGAMDRPGPAFAFREALAQQTLDLGLGRVILLEGELTDSETKNLVRCSDAFISLHRSEGFGRFLAEAMLLGKPVIATNYSGNVDFMRPELACLVSYALIPVQPDAYPFWEGQVWADPNIEEAAQWMHRIADDVPWRRALGDRASRHVRRTLSHRAIGLRLADYLAL